MGFSAFIQLQLRQAALVVDRHGGVILHGPLDVVDADVVAEDRARVLVGQLDGRAGEADERGIGQRVAHVAGEAVDEIVLAAVRLVGDDHDVAALGEHRVPVALLSGKNFWMVVKTTPPACHAQHVPQIARLSACTGGWRSRSWQREKVPKSWSSRSLRSVSTTMVGFSIAGSRMTRPA